MQGPESNIRGWMILLCQNRLEVGFGSLENCDIIICKSVKKEVGINARKVLHGRYR